MLDQLSGVEEPVAARVLYETRVFLTPGSMCDARDDLRVGGLETRLVPRERLCAFGLHGEHPRSVNQAVQGGRGPAQAGGPLDLQMNVAGKAVVTERDGVRAPKPRAERVGCEARRGVRGVELRRRGLARLELRAAFG